MTLELGKIADQVTAMGASAAQRAEERAAIVPEILKLLREHAGDAELRAKVDAAIKAGWSGAVPTAEPLDAVFDPPALPERVTIVATDGSQIYPDRHSLALYYVINVGSFVLRLGTSETPITESSPIVCFDDERLYGEDEYPVSGQVINARRAVAEMAQLARLAVEEAKQAPTVALSDANIALRVKQEGIPAAEGRQLEADYIAQLDRLQSARAPLAGFVSRPGATSVVRLAQLATFALDEVAERVKNSSRPFGGLGDTPVFAALLGPGQRSAVFELASQWGKPYKDAGHAIHFFYVNAGTPARAVIARVEVPEWVASDRQRLGLAHAAVVDQCGITGIAYPYVLTRADELAVITTAEKANFEQMIGVEMLRHGVGQVGPSEKAATKAMARYGRKR